MSDSIARLKVAHKGRNRFEREFIGCVAADGSAVFITKTAHVEHQQVRLPVDPGDDGLLF